MVLASMRVILIRVMDRAMQIHRMIRVTVFFDDVAADMAGPDNQIVHNLGGSSTSLQSSLVTMGLNSLLTNQYAVRQPSHWGIPI